MHQQCQWRLGIAPRKGAEGHAGRVDTDLFGSDHVVSVTCCLSWQLNVTAVFGGQDSNPQRLRPLRWTSQMLTATEATTAMLSRIVVVIALIYR